MIPWLACAVMSSLASVLMWSAYLDEIDLPQGQWQLLAANLQTAASILFWLVYARERKKVRTKTPRGTCIIFATMLFAGIVTMTVEAQDTQPYKFYDKGHDTWVISVIHSSDKPRAPRRPVIDWGIAIATFKRVHPHLRIVDAIPIACGSMPSSVQVSWTCEIIINVEPR